MIEIARQDEAVDERCVEEQPLEPLQRAEPDQIAAADAHEILPDMEAPVLIRGVAIAGDLDVARIAGAEAVLVREADVVDRQRIEAHHFRRHRVDRHLIGRGEHHVLHDRIHRPRARAVAGRRAVHDREETRMDLLLDRQQIDERLVNP